MLWHFYEILLDPKLCTILAINMILSTFNETYRIKDWNRQNEESWPST